ncbi:MAG: fructose PTS transporter subunit IIA [Thermoanaerobaculaceae bacterium]|jgi:fructose-specific PTS system IIA-like component
MGELASDGLAYNPRLEIGVMVEVPSAALTVDALAREADFFSIGSNDLAQYVLAVDRGNERVARLYNFFHPGFLRVLARVAADARAAGRWVGLCGELGGSALAAPLLVGLGLDEISMATPSLATMKAAIALCDAAECRDLVAAALASETAADVETLLRGFAAARHRGPLVVPDAVRLRSKSGTKSEAIKEMVDLLHLAGRLDDPDAVEDAVWQREEVYSTGVGFGVAVPHCTSSAVLATSIAVARFASPVDWGSLDEQPVEMAFLIAVDASAAGDEHLKTIAGLSRKLMDDKFRASLLAARSAAEVVALLQDVVVMQ